MNITFNDYDPFADDILITSKIHLRIKKRNKTKCITIIDGLELLIETDDEMKKILRNLKKKYCCNGSINDGNIILQGDHRSELKADLVSLLDIKSDNIEVHGY